MLVIIAIAVGIIFAAGVLYGVTAPTQYEAEVDLFVGRLDASVEAIPSLVEVPNLWIDTAAVNECYSHYLLFRHFDRRRILFGTDNISAGGFRGKYISYGNAWEAKVESQIATIGEGEVFGEMAYLLGRARMATVRAQESTVLIRIPPDVFEQLLETNIFFAREMVLVLTNRLRKAQVEDTAELPPLVYKK